MRLPRHDSRLRLKRQRHTEADVDFCASTLLNVALDDPGQESGFFAWWRGARDLLIQRYFLRSAELHVLGRGKYLAVLGFPLPGAWKLVVRDRRWKQLEAERPAAQISIQHARRWHAEGNPRDATTSDLVGLAEAKRRGERDLILVDTLPPASFAARHLPGAVNLPLANIEDRRNVAAV